MNGVLLSKTECYKVGNKPLFLLGLVSLAEPVETLCGTSQRLRTLCYPFGDPIGGAITKPRQPSRMQSVRRWE